MVRSAEISGRLTEVLPTHPFTVLQHQTRCHTATNTHTWHRSENIHAGPTKASWTPGLSFKKHCCVPPETGWELSKGSAVLSLALFLPQKPRGSTALLQCEGRMKAGLSASHLLCTGFGKETEQVNKTTQKKHVIKLACTQENKLKVKSQPPHGRAVLPAISSCNLPSQRDIRC